MYQLKYDENKKVIIQIDPNGKKTTIADDFPSKPILSPDNKKAIYISPLEWECLGSLYLYILETGYITELISPDKEQNIPKYADWIDDDNIVVIIGYGMGTIEVGGNVFIYNITKRKLKQITEYPPEVQIYQININNEFMELIGIKYTDENFNEYIKFKEKIQINQTI